MRRERFSNLQNVYIQYVTMPRRPDKVAHLAILRLSSVLARLHGTF